MNWEYIGLTKHKRRKISFSVNLSCRHKNRIWVQNPETQKWDIGFYSYDRRGIIVWHYGWKFFPIIAKYPMLNRRLSEFRDGYKGHKLPFEFCLGKAINIENKVCEALEEHNTDYFIYHLHESGVRSHGSDIIISKKKKLDEDVFTNVKNSYCAIEVLGTKFYHGKNRFTYHGSKDFYKWMVELNEYGIMPIIAWIDNEGNAKFMLLTRDNLIDVFYYKDKDGYLRQRTNYSPVVNAEKYGFSARDLMFYIPLYVKVVKISESIDKNKPLIIHTAVNKVVLTSPSWNCEDLEEYERALGDIRGDIEEI